MKQKEKTFRMVLTAFFLGILVLFASVPFLGFIPLGPINATTLHIPVIIASIILGPKIGAFMGGCFGLISMIRSTIIITPLSFVFSPFVAPLGSTGSGSWKALLIAFIPRILIGIIPYYVYIGCQQLFTKKKKTFSLFLAGLLGSITNTILVMNMIYFLFQKDYAEIMGKAGNAVYGAILTVIFTQGVPEALVGGIAASAVCTILFKLVKQRI
ncbi:MAG TPA: ECF transporter S component [Candidatus Tetragenococcus pullicola]|nr:ECF transporter S component [Candidatus Tetragenococcus pullicola]